MTAEQTATGGSAIKFPKVTSDNSEVVGCCNIQDICDIIKDDITYPYENDSQTATFYGVHRQDGLAKVLGMYTNMMSMNGMMDQMSTPDGNVFQANMPDNGVFNGGSGPKIVEMPMTGVGSQLIRTGFKDYRASTENDYQFTISDEILDANGGAIGDNLNCWVLPSFYQIYASDDAGCGCDKSCCGDGAREWFITKADGSKEKVWVMNTPPDGVLADPADFGVQADGTVKVWVVRGVGQYAKPCETEFMPDAYGTPVEVECGDTISIGNVVPMNGCGCLPCPKVGRRNYERTEFQNCAQRITEGIFCFSQQELYTKTYLTEPNHIKRQYKRNLDAMMKRVANTFLYGQKTSFPGAALNNDTYPGTGTKDEGCNTVPSTTDGLLTLLDKHARVIDLCIEGGCDNRCLIDELREILSSLIGPDMGGNPVLVGDDYLLSYYDQMVRNEVTAHSFDVAQQKIGRGLYQATPGVANGIFNYDIFDIGGRSIPFILDREMQKREPGVMYLMYLDAIEIFHPNNELDKRNGFLGSTAGSGSFMPLIYTNESMVNVNGQNQMMSANNCPKEVYATMQFGVWYTPSYYPKTFKIRMSGINDDGDVVPLTDVSCGCYANGINTYATLVS